MPLPLLFMVPEDLEFEPPRLIVLFVERVLLFVELLLIPLVLLFRYVLVLVPVDGATEALERPLKR